MSSTEQLWESLQAAIGGAGFDVEPTPEELCAQGFRVQHWLSQHATLLAIELATVDSTGLRRAVRDGEAWFDEQQRKAELNGVFRDAYLLLLGGEPTQGRANDFARTRLKQEARPHFCRKLVILTAAEVPLARVSVLPLPPAHEYQAVEHQEGSTLSLSADAESLMDEFDAPKASPSAVGKRHRNEIDELVSAGDESGGSDAGR